MKLLSTLTLILFCSSFYAQDIEDGLIGHWLMNDEEEIIDQSSTGMNGYIDSGILTEDRFGVEEEAMSFDGQFEYAVINEGLEGLNDVTCVDDATFSISLWHKTADILPDLSPLICKYAHTGCGDVERQWALLIAQNEGIRFYYAETPDNLNYRSISTLDTVAHGLETWYHIVVTYDGSLDENDGLDRVSIYVDNELQADTLNFAIGNMGETISTGNAPIGLMDYVSTNDDACGQYNAPGALDDIRFYDRVIMDTEVELLFLEGVVSVDEMAAFDASISVYPTLIEDGVVTISSSSVQEELTLEIYSIQGELVQQNVFTSFEGSKEIRLNSISSGAYIVKLRNESGLQSVKKVVVK